MFRNNGVGPGLALLVLLSCCLLLLPFVHEIPNECGTQIAFKLRAIALAMHMYHEKKRHLPPAVVRDKNGKPLYSWRVLLLPYLEEEDLYKEFHLDEPWDSPHNKLLVENTPRCFGTSVVEDPPGFTRFQVFVGRGTAFDRDGLTLDDFANGTSRTFLVAEGSEPVPWSKPADLMYDPDGPLPALGGQCSRPVRRFLGFTVAKKPVFHVAFADGSCRSFRIDTDERILRALITRTEGGPIDLSELD
jgi:Protein of unknown function (DUF1559)